MKKTAGRCAMPKLTIKENMTPIDRKCVEIGISRLELSRRSGVSARTLEAWGKRLRIPRDVYQLYKVAQALECHIEDLFEPELAEAAKNP
jgi:transcriptional regulator with XRE-family HTH domain